MSNAIILAGGKATRLGPLAVQLNKCLVTIGQQPMLVHQVDVFRKSGVRHVTVVASTESIAQVTSVVESAYTGLDDIRIDVIAQRGGSTPIVALVDGLEHQLASRLDGGTFVIAADTLLDRIPDRGQTWGSATVYTGDAGGREWCVHEVNGKWSDRPAYEGESIYTGLSWLQSILEAYRTLAPSRVQGRQIGTAAAMNALDAGVVRDDIGWLDVGDIDALARARRTRYNSRSFNRLELDDDGVVWKTGAGDKFKDEQRYMLELEGDALPLFPRVFNDGDSTRYGLEHIDQPTLAELWLYWPGDDTMWQQIITHLLHRVERALWLPRVDAFSDVKFAAEQFYAMNLEKRLASWMHPLAQRKELVVNGLHCWAGHELLKRFIPLVQDVASRAIPGGIHGDLSFLNILWSLTTGQPKLLDPRGSFGSLARHGDVRYDLAKIRYSYHGGVVAILHGLYELEHDDETVELRLGAARQQVEHHTLDDVIEEYARLSDVAVIEAVTCLAAAPLHTANEQEALALYTRGVQLANQFI